MSRRRSGAGGKRDGGPPSPVIAHVYEGPEVLSSLLARAGSPHDAAAVADTFARAQAAGEPRASVVPALFPDEPKFDSPEAARRLYGNLFGLWDRLAAGLGPHDDAPEVVVEPPPPPPLPERGAAPGRGDRYQNVQPDLAAWLESAPLPETGALAALDLVFEAWAMFDQAFGDRLGAVEWKELRALEQEPPPAEESQPAIALYAAEQLDIQADEDPAFGDPDRAQVEKVFATAVAALTRAVHEPS